MDPHLRIRSSSFVSGPSRSAEPVRPATPGRRSGVITTLLVLIGGTTAVAIAGTAARLLTSLS